jgi:hypothetical protein
VSPRGGPSTAGHLAVRVNRNICPISRSGDRDAQNVTLHELGLEELCGPATVAHDSDACAGGITGVGLTVGAANVWAWGQGEAGVTYTPT